MLDNDKEYMKIVDDIKKKIRSAQYRAVLSANNELTVLYWNIGKIINDNSTRGNKFLLNLARDIKLDFPDAKGYSVRNLKYMSKFAQTYPDLEKVQSLPALLPWTHNVLVLDKLKDENERIWYIQKTIEEGWSVRTLEDQIEMELYERQALSGKTNNFHRRLAAPQSDLAEQIMKDPYVFSFAGYRKSMVEREVERELVKNVSSLLLELGTGFAFVGNQYLIKVEDEDFYIDLLFYHLELRCFVVIELKTGNFEPEFAGKLNFYITAVDELLRKEQDNPTIGLLLCKNKKGMIAEYSLRDINKPMGVSEYKLFDKLPKEYENMLPSAEDIERRIGLNIDENDTEEGVFHVDKEKNFMIV